MDERDARILHYSSKAIHGEGIHGSHLRLTLNSAEVAGLVKIKVVSDETSAEKTTRENADNTGALRRAEKGDKIMYDERPPVVLQSVGYFDTFRGVCAMSDMMWEVVPIRIPFLPPKGAYPADRKSRSTLDSAFLTISEIRFTSDRRETSASTQIRLAVGFSCRRSSRNNVIDDSADFLPAT